VTVEEGRDMKVKGLIFLIFVGIFFSSSNLYPDDLANIYIVQRPEHILARLGEVFEIEINVIRPSSVQNSIRIKHVTPPVSELVELISSSQESSSLIENEKQKLLQIFRYRYRAEKRGEAVLESFVLEFHSKDGDILLRKGPVGSVRVASVWIRYRSWAIVLFAVMLGGVVLKLAIEAFKKNISKRKLKETLKKRRKSKFSKETEVLDDIEQLKYLLSDGKQKDYLLELRSHLRDYFDNKHMIGFDKKSIHEGMRQVKDRDIWVRIYSELEVKIDQVTYAEVELSSHELKQLTRKIINQIKQSMEEDLG